MSGWSDQGSHWENDLDCFLEETAMLHPTEQENWHTQMDQHLTLFSFQNAFKRQVVKIVGEDELTEQIPMPWKSAQVFTVRLNKLFSSIL